MDRGYHDTAPMEFGNHQFSQSLDRRHRLLQGCRVEGLVGSEIVEPESLGQTINPASFGDLLAGAVLRWTRLHGGEFGQRGLPRGLIARLMADHQLMQQVGAFEHDAASRGGRGDLS